MPRAARVRPAAWSLALVLLATACGPSRPAATPVPGPTSGIAPEWAYRGKARVTDAPHAVVVSGSPLASAVGRDILQAGGNAIDAATAVGFALAVVHPEAGNIGGGGFSMIRLASGEVAALDYREAAPGRGSRDMYLDLRGDPSQLSITGALSAGVPGSVAGLVEQQRKYGRLPFAQVIAPAIRLAEEGFVVDEYRMYSINSERDRLYVFPASRRQFLPDGQAPRAGTLFRQPDLARTLSAIRDQGRDGFYTGWVADSIVAEMDRDGGFISKADLAAYQAKWRTPVEAHYRGHVIYSMPPASSGGITLAEILNIMQGFGPLPAFGSPALLHLEAEAMRRAFTDRNHFLGDADFVDVPQARLTSMAYADSLRATIDLHHASRSDSILPGIDGMHTTHYSVVDAEGNAVSTTTTLNNSYGSAVTVSGAGFLLNDEMDDFATAPGKPNMYGLVQGEANAIQPGKRMLSAMTPSLVVGPDGQLKMVVGTPGGPTIITQVYHVISNVIDHGMSLPDAVAAPRMHHQGLPDEIRLERGGFYPGTIAGLQAMGHTVTFRTRWGDVEAIIRTPDGWEGVSDPRLGGG
ncbi:MAG TPA: gamma-glutamyltransferase, partial [Gemmatimonadales bacterium]|nr:gamma-glutamyltransferase [Gemmatimonadales bacterium]